MFIKRVHPRTTAHLVNDLGVDVPVVDQAVDLGHHGGAVDAGGEGVHRRVVLALLGRATRRAHLQEEEET